MADTTTEYSVGANVYNGGSSAATIGPVDPMGYIDRTLNNKTPTYTPGVAAGALDTIKNNASSSSPTPVAPTVAPTPTSSSTTGKINYNMPVGYDLQLKGIEADSNYQNLMSELTAQKNAAATEQTINERNLGQQFQGQLRTTLNRASGRGMARSSGYIDQFQNVQADYNNSLADIRTRFMNALNSSDARMADGGAQRDQMWGAVMREAAQRLADKRINDENSGAIDPITGLPTSNPSSTLNAGSQPTATSKAAPKPLVAPKKGPSEHQMTVLRHPGRYDAKELAAAKAALSTHQLNVWNHLSRYTAAEIKAAGF
jgi:hypothetical protein